MSIEFRWLLSRQPMKMGSINVGSYEQPIFQMLQYRTAEHFYIQTEGFTVKQLWSDWLDIPAEWEK